MAPGTADDLAATAGAEPDLVTVVGRLAASLAARFRTGGAPVDVVSCDNTAGTARRWPVVSGSSSRRRHGATATPCSTGSRPRSASRTRSSTGSCPPPPRPTATPRPRALGVRDEMAVVGEPYRSGCSRTPSSPPGPRWEIDGALVVADVAPYQLMKLRLLNGSHSAMAYLGAAAGCATVADVLATEWGEPFVRAFGAEVAPTLPDAGLDAKRYVDDLVARFRNPTMHHLLRQIGTDGSLKIPERWLPALRELRAAGTSDLGAGAGAGRLGRRDRARGAGRPGVRHDGSRHGVRSPAAGRSPRRSGLVAALLRTVGATDLAEQADLTASVAARLPAVRAGQIEL